MSTGYVWVNWDCQCDVECGCKADGEEQFEIVEFEVNQIITCHECGHETKVRWRE